jgi:hypothetical protein
MTRRQERVPLRICSSQASRDWRSRQRPALLTRRPAVGLSRPGPRILRPRGAVHPTGPVRDQRVGARIQSVVEKSRLASKVALGYRCPPCAAVNGFTGPDRVSARSACNGSGRWLSGRRRFGFSALALRVSPRQPRSQAYPRHRRVDRTGLRGDAHEISPPRQGGLRLLRSSGPSAAGSTRVLRLGPERRDGGRGFSFLRRKMRARCGDIIPLYAAWAKVVGIP